MSVESMKQAAFYLARSHGGNLRFRRELAEKIKNEIQEGANRQAHKKLVWISSSGMCVQDDIAPAYGTPEKIYAYAKSIEFGLRIKTHEPN